MGQTDHRLAAVASATDIEQESARDTALLRRAQGGEDSAFEALVERHRDKVFALARRMLGVDADAAEVTQESFLAAYKNLPHFRAEAAFGSWVYRIAANFALMRLRHRRVTSEVEEPLEGPQFNDRGSLVDPVTNWTTSRDAESLTLDAELRHAIEQSAAALPEDHRRVFFLRDLDGLSYEEIAEVTGDSVPAIKSRLHRARLAMRAAIDAYYAEKEP